MESQQDDLKRRFNYEVWQVKRGEDEGRLVSRVSLRGDELPGFAAHRIQRIESGENFPAYVRSIWQQSKSEGDVLITMDLYECASTSAAREFLLRLLGEFQSPEVERQTPGTVGDVAFVYPGDTMLLFSRRNVVVWLRNAGPQVVSVMPLAQTIDRNLSSSDL